jgi:hypothetical protein
MNPEPQSPDLAFEDAIAASAGEEVRGVLDLIGVRALEMALVGKHPRVVEAARGAYTQAELDDAVAWCASRPRLQRRTVSAFERAVVELLRLNGQEAERRRLAAEGRLEFKAALLAEQAPPPEGDAAPHD